MELVRIREPCYTTAIQSRYCFPGVADQPGGASLQPDAARTRYGDVNALGIAAGARYPEGG